MKQGRNPTVAQRRWMESEGLNSAEWYVSKWTVAEATLIHKTTGEIKVLTFLE